MNGYDNLPTLDALKQQAKNLRTRLNEDGETIGHSKSLEIIARQFGFKDWNTLHARAGNQPPAPFLTVGQRVKGRYLGQSFEGEVLALQTQPTTGRIRATFQFDEAVDVVSFESFSALRKRVSCFIKSDGKTVEKTSDGSPQMVLEL